MAVGILVLVVSCAAIAAGCTYARAARHLARFETTRGTVLAREVAIVPGASSGEGRWGKGGRYWPRVTYEYVVNGVTYSSDRWSYAFEGLKRSVAEQTLSAVPDVLDVHYDPADPRVAYLHGHSPRLGYLLVCGGVIGTVIALLALLS